MKTIMILVEALQKCAKEAARRVDIQYNNIDCMYKARVWISELVFDVCENGIITKVEE